MRHKESSIFPRGAMRRGKAGRWQSDAGGCGENYEGSKIMPRPWKLVIIISRRPSSKSPKRFLWVFVQTGKGAKSIHTCFFFSGCCEAKLGLCVQIQKMNYVNVSSRNLQSHKGASWALRSIVRLCLGKRQHQIMSGSHVPHVCKYVGETSVGKGVEWKIMLLVSTLVMVEVTTTKKSIKT